MKIGFISDLHFDANRKIEPSTYFHTLLQLIKDREISTLILGGDLSNRWQTTRTFVEELQEKAGLPIYFIPGNHEFWEGSHSEKHTYELYRKMRHHPQSLLEHPLLLNDDWAVVGHTAWYNYAYADDRFTEERLASGQFKACTWRDKRELDWQVPDPEISSDFAQLIEKDIQNLPPHRKIILVTHMVTVPQFVVPLPNKFFDYFNAYLGTDDCLPFYQKYPIYYSVMGHNHIRAQFKDNKTTYICACLGYPREWRTNDLAAEMTDALYTLDLPDSSD